MMADGFVAVQEIAKTSERKRADSFYLWYVPLKEMQDRVLATLFFSWANLRNRVQEEQVRIKILLDKIKQNLPETISPEVHTPVCTPLRRTVITRVHMLRCTCAVWVYVCGLLC